jgi:hypothetical protein
MKWALREAVSDERLKQIWWQGPGFLAANRQNIISNQ